MGDRNIADQSLDVADIKVVVVLLGFLTSMGVGNCAEVVEFNLKRGGWTEL